MAMSSHHSRNASISRWYVSSLDNVSGKGVNADIMLAGDCPTGTLCTLRVGPPRSAAVRGVVRG